MKTDKLNILDIGGKETQVFFKNEKPKNWDLLEKTFGVSWERVAVAYGNTAYSKYPLLDDVKAHELVHLKQQKYNEKDADIWWKKYIADEHFRFDQELEAYQEQYKYLKARIKNSQTLFERLDKMAKDLSGSMYGNLTTYGVAMRIIKKGR